MSTWRIVLTGVLVALAAPGAAQAAWSEPIDIGPPSNGSEVVGLALTPRGETVLGWRLFDTSFVARLRADGAPRTPVRLSAELVAGPALATTTVRRGSPGTRRAIIVMRRLLQGRGSARGAPPRIPVTRLTWALVGPDGRPGRARTLATARCLSCQVRLAVNWRGDAIAAWTESSGVRASYRRAGGRFGRPVTLSKPHGQYPDVAAAIGADGRAIVVDAGRSVRARVRTRRGTFGRTKRVGRGNDSIRVSAAVSNAGRAIVAWGSQDGGEEANERWIVRAAQLRRGGRSFTARQTLDAGGAIARPEGRIAIALTPGGKATVAWSAVARGARFPVMVAAARSGRRFATARRIAPSGAVGGAAVRADGAAVVVWSRLLGSQQPVGVFASWRPAGATTFGAPEAVGRPGAAFFPPIVAFDPVRGTATAAWGARPVPPSPPDVVDNAIVHVSSRAPH